MVMISKVIQQSKKRVKISEYPHLKTPLGIHTHLCTVHTIHGVTLNMLERNLLPGNLFFIKFTKIKRMG